MKRTNTEIRLPSYDILVNFNEQGGGAITCCPDLDTAPFQGILRMVLAHAIAGVDIESPAYLEGLETAVEGIANEL